MRGRNSGTYATAILPRQASSKALLYGETAWVDHLRELDSAGIDTDQVVEWIRKNLCKPEDVEIVIPLLGRIPSASARKATGELIRARVLQTGYRVFECLDALPIDAQWTEDLLTFFNDYLRDQSRVVERAFGVLPLFRAMGRTGSDAALIALANLIPQMPQLVQSPIIATVAEAGRADLLPDAPKLIAQWESEQQANVVQHLWRWPGIEPFRWLTIYLSSFNPSLVASACTGLGHLKDERAIPHLHSYLGSPHPDVQCAAAKALRSLTASSAHRLTHTGRLLAVLEWAHRAADTDQPMPSGVKDLPGTQAPSVHGTLLALGVLGDPSAIPQIKAHLDGPGDIFNMTAAAALHALGDPDGLHALKVGIARGEFQGEQAIRAFGSQLSPADRASAAMLFNYPGSPWDTRSVLTLEYLERALSRRGSAWYFLEEHCARIEHMAAELGFRLGWKPLA